MDSYQNNYISKRVSAEKAVSVVKSGDWVDYTMAHGFPTSLDEALSRRKGELKDVKVRSCVTLRPAKIVENDPERETFTFHSWHFSAYDRKLCAEGRCFYIPLLYRNMPMHYEKMLDVDVAMLSVTPMDRHGYFSFSLNNSASAAIVRKAKTVIVEVNESLPRVYGLGDDCIHISEVDYIVEGDNPALPVMDAGDAGEVETKIAEYVVEEIVDNAVIQLGIGSLPNIVGKLLASSDLKNLGGHTEMLVDAYLFLHEAGKLTNRNKQIHRGKTIWSFCIGSGELYDWVEQNPGLASASVRYVNDPYVIGGMDNFISINSCTEIDLFGQVCGECFNGKQVSGTGGQLDFLTGSYMAKGGKSLICMPSTYTDRVTGALKSRVTPLLTKGNVVTDPRTQGNYVVTEYGKVCLSGCSTWEIAEKLISIAHPRFREELTHEAEALGVYRNPAGR
jgi:butyryl-CoA:acetate CoA-transferase